jgi:hypothetical protein
MTLRCLEEGHPQLIGVCPVYPVRFADEFDTGGNQSLIFGGEIIDGKVEQGSGSKFG